jgi:hypothetical protein
MVIQGQFVTPFSSDNGAKSFVSKANFVARVFSPNICVTNLCTSQGEHIVISAATPGENGQCTIRVSVALPAGPGGEPPDPQLVRALLRDSKLAYDQDVTVWENLIPGAPSRFDTGDELIVAFRKFCKTFTEVDHYVQGGAR